MATLSLEKVSLVTRGHHVEVVAVGPIKLGTGLALGALPFSVHSGDTPKKLENGVQG